jgi:hypothetical protein
MEILTPLRRDHRGAVKRFQPVEERHDRILVIASGPSGAGPWDVRPGVPVIAVNGAIDGLPWDPEYWFTLDPSPVNYARITNPRHGTKYFVGVDGDYGPEAHLMKYRQDFTGCHLLWVKREERVSDDTRKITVGNSGRAAVHLAMHMGATRIGVLGVDGTSEAHWHDPAGHSGNLKALGRNLDVLHRGGVQFLFGDTGTSTVVGHPKASPQKVLDWLHE